MARTKQTKKHWTSTAGKKRRSPENDQHNQEETERKRVRLSQSSDSNDNRPSMKGILDDINTTLNSTSYTPTQLESFAQKLLNLSTSHHERLKELRYRKNSVTSFLTAIKRGIRNNPQNRYGEEQYYNQKLYDFSQSMVKGFRFSFINDREECDCGGITHYTDYSLDFALKSVDPHPEYTKIVSKLLSKYIDGINDICLIVCSYTVEPQRWYRIEATECTDSDADRPITHINDALVWRIKFNTDDYFRDNEYYKKQQIGTHSYMKDRKRIVKFNTLREELGTKEITELTDVELSCFFVLIALIELNMHVLTDMEDWIEKEHT